MKFDKLSPTTQIIIVVLVIIGVFIIIRGGKTFFERLGLWASTTGENMALSATGQTKTFTTGQYNQFAEQLFFAMDGPGTDEDAIFDVFRQMKNDADINALNQAFGVREGSDNLFGLIKSSDLKGWLRSDLSSDEMKTLNRILSQKGITKTF